MADSDFKIKLNNNKLGGAVLLWLLIPILIFFPVIGLYPHFILSTAAFFPVILITVYRWGLISIPAYSTVLLTYPALVPFISTYLYGVEHYTPLGVKFESLEIASKSVYLTLLFILIHLATISTINTYETSAKNYLPKLKFNTPAFLTVGAIVIVSSFLLAPGSTILTTSYGGQIAKMASWAVFAGGLYKGGWSLLYILVSNKPAWDKYYGAFVVITLISSVWLLAHGRRGASFGLLVLLLVDIYWNRVELSMLDLFTSLKGALFMLGGSVLVVLLYLVGRFRLILATINRGDVNSVLIEGVSSLSYGNGFAGVPGGGHGIYGTLQATMYIFQYERSFLYGSTFINYILLSIPSGIFALTPLDKPRSYRTILEASYNWNGGNFIINPYYANFGILGLLLGGTFIGLIVVFIYQQIELTDTDHNLPTLLAAVLFVNMLTSYWYGQITWIDTLQGATVCSVIYLTVAGIAKSFQTNFHHFSVG